MCGCLRVWVLMYALRIVSPDKILLCINSVTIITIIIDLINFRAK